MNMLKKYAKPAAFVAAGVVVGLAIATTAIGAKATAKIAALRTKAGF
jgi:hypothetical protein